ncbi:uncharacterized protein isoform X2 [Choristoneura fumiferana]|uniref:uncharacterized protein isoform X2 n=1 Tax=Choristoneura fumiferana TaxID=7141 RepID=UPI003D15CDE0
MYSCLRKYFSPFVCQNEELSLLQIFKPLYILLSAVGLFPSAIEFSNGKENYIVAFKSSPINLVPTLLITTITCIFFYLHMQVLSVVSENNYLTSDPMTLANYVTNLVITLLVVFIIYINAFKNRRSYITILNEMAGCWADLSKSTTNDISRLRVQVNCLVLGSLIVMLIVQLVITFTEGDPTYMIAMITMSFNLPEMIQFTVLAFYFTMILMITTILKNIDEHLAMIARGRIVSGMGNDYVGLKIESSLESLRRLRGVYARAMVVKRQVNAAFQAPLLFILAQSFHALVSDAHGLYHIVIISEDFTTHNVVEECFWVVYQLIKYHILGYASALLEMQANKIGRTLYDNSAYGKEQIQCKSSTDIIEQISLHLEIQHFSALMKFQNTQITIYGLFPLKSSLLFNLIASAAIYLVILVQFDNNQ